MPRIINDIIVHCTDTPYKMDCGADQVTAWHKENGWSRCGYHYIIKLDGTIEAACPISKPGIHCKGHNAHSVGVCYVGGRDSSGALADTRTPAQKASLLKLIYNLIVLYRCDVHSHHDYNKNKACPCFDARKEYHSLYTRYVLRLPADTPQP